MKPNQSTKGWYAVSAWRNGLIGSAVLLASAILATTSSASNIVLWDTGSRESSPTEPGDRSAWKIVPSELFAFEADPAKAASDPGYYGREYSFQGDIAVETSSLTTIFWRALGRVGMYSKTNPAPAGQARATSGKLGLQLLELTPWDAQSATGTLTHCEILRNGGDEVILQVSFSGAGATDRSATFSFSKDGIVGITPGAGMLGYRLRSPIEYALVPGFIGDDLIFGPAKDLPSDTVALPSENIFVGLIRGEGSALVATWPKGNQGIQLRVGQDSANQRVIESVDFLNDGQAFYLSALSAPGIWHREELKANFLEKDVPSQWKRPFPAKWKTLLSEAGVRTSFAFRERKGQIWRGVPGSYQYPVWFEGETATYHLSKKVPPKGESIVYFLEGEDTPLTIPTPVEVMKSTLGRPLADALIDAPGRRLRTHHRRGGEGVHRACTCGCTEAIQAVFEAGQEVEKRDEVSAALADMNYFVSRHVERIEEYTRFSTDLISYLRSQSKTSPALKGYCEALEPVAQGILQEYEVQKENMKSMEHAKALTRQTLALTEGKAPNNLTAYMELLKAWRAMGGAQDYVLAQCHATTRKLFQEASYAGANQPGALAVAKEIRARCRQVLRNPDGYEIWADY